MRNRFATPGWHHLVQIAGFLAVAAVIGSYVIDSPPAAASPGVECKSLSSLVDSMARDRIGVVATGLVTVNDATLPVMLVRAQRDGSWMMLATNVATDEACPVLSGPSLQVARGT